MPIQTPPAIIAPSPLPSHVHPTLADAEMGTAAQSAPGSQRSILAYIPTTKAQEHAAQDWTASLSGARARGSYEVWIDAPGGPEGAALLNRFNIASAPAVLDLTWTKKGGLTLNHARYGADATDPSRTFDLIGEPTPQDIAEGAASLLAKHPDLGDQARLIAFQTARQADLRAAATEPYRTWLMGILKTSKDKDAQAWAATRLVEATALLKAGDIQPLPFVAARAYDDMFKLLKGFMPLQPVADPFKPFGAIADIPDDAPFWPAFRHANLTGHGTPITPMVYALMAPHIQEGDRAWVLAQFETDKEGGDPWNSAAFWMALDWLLVYGSPLDWQGFKAAAPNSRWASQIEDKARFLQNVPAYWDVPRRVQDMFCAGVTADDFWKNPDACLAAWGVTRESLVTLAWNEDRVKQQAGFPGFPMEAKMRRLSNSISLQLLVDATGHARSIRPEPGYGLAFFAPSGMAWASKTIFEPAMVAGVPRPEKFLYHLNYKLR